VQTAITVVSDARVTAGRSGLHTSLEATACRGQERLAAKINRPPQVLPPPTSLLGRRLIGVRSGLVIAAQLDVNSSAPDAFLGEDCARQTQLDLGQLENMLHAVMSVSHPTSVAESVGRAGLVAIVLSEFTVRQTY